MMRLSIISIERLGQGRCLVRFSIVDGGTVEAVFTVQESPVGLLSSSEPDVLFDCGGDAHDARSVAAAVMAFCRAADPGVFSG